MLFAGGSGYPYIAREDLDLIGQQTQLRPSKWEDHLGLLAAVNRRTASRVPDKSVSPSCHVSYLSVDSPSGQGRSFVDPGESSSTFKLQVVLAGIDLTETTHLLAKALRNEPPSDEAMAEAYRRAVDGRP
jgi:hypothetical protein